MIKVLIADDEKHARERLKKLLSHFDFVTIDVEVKNGDEVIQSLITKEIDVAFLDINMPGVSVFNTIKSLKNPPLVVFQTAYSEYAVDAFEISALDYLMKPINPDRLKKTMEKICDILNQASEASSDVTIDENVNHEPIRDKLSTVPVKIGDEITLVSVTDIYKISYEDGLCFIYTAEKKYISDKYLNYYEEALEPSGFFRCSRNDIVNLSCIKSLHKMFKGTMEIELKNDLTVPVSRRKAKLLKEMINL